ncbi:MAG: efflux RND transporter permease subunit, partial [Rhodocyclaceae bacterium]|nr:efflux RND transporter permease subunit [Rhodocyclaceae bacterium]
TADAVEEAVEKLRPSFPDGVDVMTAFDTTPFVRISIHSVIETLIEAVILVFCVMYLFLQNVRATLIATLVVPVVLLGTFGVMAALGFSINTLTLFGLVLAIGLLVDDAIVVVENVERVMSEEGLAPKEATKKSMEQITGALVGIGLVLSAVFIPMAFFPGSVGVIYRQFSVTIAAAVGLSVLVAIVFTPALCATILKPVEQGHHLSEGGPLGAFFHWFNDWFARLTGSYQSSVEKILRRGVRFFFIYLLLVGGLVFTFMRLPSAFLPEEDQGVLFAQIVLPAGATQERTLEVMEKMRKYFDENEKSGVESVMAVAGFSFSGTGQNVALAFIRLKDWKERDLVQDSARAIQGRAMVALSQSIKEAQVFTFVPPAIPGLGTSGGFSMVLQDRVDMGHDKLLAARNQLLGMAMQDPMLANLRPNGVEDSPQYEISIDRDKAMTLGVNVADINSTLSIAMGSLYVNDFIDRGRVKRVVMQGDDFSRMNADDLNRWYVRNSAGEMTPFSAFMTGKWSFAPSQLERYDGVGAMQLQGEAAPGFSSGQAMDRMEELAEQIPGIGVDWTGLSYEERLSSAMAPALYALSLLVVFLCLAALY